MTMKRLLACMFAVFLCLSLFAQENEARDKYGKFRREMHDKYDSFRNKANAAYADFVEQAWSEYKMLPAVPKPEEKTVPPVVFPDKDKGSQPLADDKPVPFEEVVPIDKPDPQPLPVSPIREVPQPDEQYFHFLFYNTELKVRLGDSLRFSLRDCSEASIAYMWESMCSGRYDNLIRDCIELRLKCHLCDWAYLQMLDSISNSFYGEDTNEATLLTAFLYCQSGYQMRLARENDKLVLLFSSKHHIYERGYFDVGGIWFYPFNNSSCTLDISKAYFPEEKPLSLFVTDEQMFALNASQSRKLQSERYDELNVSASVNVNLIDFYNTYPASCVNDDFGSRWVMYANTELSEYSRNTFYDSLMLSIDGLTQLEAVNRILNFVQTAFEYEYDDTLWGGDRAFFPEETLYYPYCDCEDRSILFSRLIRDLVGLDVALVYYPGHLAAAVHFTENIEGDYLLFGEKKYIICDPTYIGAPVGYTMPDMDNTKAKVIFL